WKVDWRWTRQSPGRRTRALGRRPGDWRVQRPVDLPYPGAVAVAGQTARVPLRELIAEELDRLVRVDVEHRRPCIGELAQRRHALSRDDLAAVCPQKRDEGRGDGLRAAARHGQPT